MYVCHDVCEGHLYSDAAIATEVNTRIYDSLLTYKLDPKAMEPDEFTKIINLELNYQS